MTKMNRRDYLIQMGAGAGSIAGAFKSELSAREQNPGAKSSSRLLEAPSRLDMTKKRRAVVSSSHWPPTPNWPANPSVRLLFWGIIAFCYNKKKGCEIAFHSCSPTHKLGIRVYENCRQIFPPLGGEIPGNVKKIEFGIIDKPMDVAFYQEPILGSFDRVRGSEHDFRWLLDFEGDDLYKKKFSKNSGVFFKKLYVSHGTFYTYQRTQSLFDIRGGAKEYTGIHLARIMAADIELGQRECMALKFDGRDVLAHPLCWKQGTEYEVHFTNECYKPDGMPCTDGDFYLNFDLIKIHPKDRFEIVLNKYYTEQDPHICEARYRVSDEAPCMGAGFGQTGGFPGS